MTTLELQRELSLSPADGVPFLEREVEGFYCGDLLSWVMGRARPGSAWLTVMNNVNVAAVAVMCEAACVILCEGVEPDAALKERAAANGVCILCSQKDVYTLAAEAGRLWPHIPGAYAEKQCGGMP